MEFLDQAQYQYWAEKQFFDLLSKINDENWSKKLPEFTKSLQEIYIHKYEVMFFWFTLIHVKDSKKIAENPLNIPDFDPLTKEQFATEALKLFERVLDYIKTTKDTTVSLTVSWLKSPYKVTIHEVFFNILNHLAYHRGQTAFIFKKFGVKEIPETDYNPYAYKLKGLT